MNEKKEIRYDEKYEKKNKEINNLILFYVCVTYPIYTIQQLTNLPHDMLISVTQLSTICQHMFSWLSYKNTCYLAVFLVH